MPRHQREGLLDETLDVDVQVAVTPASVRPPTSGFHDEGVGEEDADVTAYLPDARAEAVEVPEHGRVRPHAERAALSDRLGDR
ncbi:hypothetical protein [Streptomyces sp. 150FB]|uniref:hypothetical protein n=1 Tax=Streptomyces sp. 150FB TaxID=1576605 RepID=UPI0012376A99|nr:hypothetical protein [Streptomyces sp. 150FB]